MRKIVCYILVMIVLLTSITACNGRDDMEQSDHQNISESQSNVEVEQEEAIDNNSVAKEESVSESAQDYYDGSSIVVGDPDNYIEIDDEMIPVDGEQEVETSVEKMNESDSSGNDTKNKEEIGELPENTSEKDIMEPPEESSLIEIG